MGTSTGTLSIATSVPEDLAILVGEYRLKLKVFFTNMPSKLAEREFLVEVIDPCVTASF